MNRNRLIAIAVLALLLVAGAALIVSKHGGAAADDADVTPTANVTVSPIRSEALQDIVTLFGIVQADPGASTTLAAPRAVIVSRVLVRQGEAVAGGQPLVEVVSAPGSDMAYRQAANAATAAQTDLARVQRLFDERLAASDQLIAAKKTLADAEAALAAQQRQGAGQELQRLVAPAPALVVSLAAAPGDHLAQDAPIMTLARQGALSVRLGVEPSMGPFAVGQAVTIRPNAGGAPIDSWLSSVGRAADLTTKTLGVVAPLPGAGLPIGTGVSADVVTGSHQGLAVPRAAVVYDETGNHVFVVANGKAQRVFVTVGRDHGDETEIKGPVAAGQPVAVQGAYELQDGMAVKVGP